MTVAIGVVAHHKRIIQAWNLVNEVDASFLSVDRGDMGATTNHVVVWSWLAKDWKDHRAYSEWSVVLEDDAVPCPGFRYQLEQALKVAPTDVVGLYLGTGNPPAWQGFIGHAKNDPAHWTMASHLLHGVGTAIRTELVADMCNWVAAYDHDMPIDSGITEWCRAHARQVAYTRPSIVDHRDGPTLIEHPDGADRESARRAWDFGTRETWNNTTVLIP